MKYLFFVFSLLTSAVCAQQVHYTGSIIDAQNKQPIPNSTVSIQSKNLYFPADNGGKFDISSIQISMDDSIAFSCIGYQTRKIKAADTRLEDSIFLSPVINTLQEVEIKSGPVKLVQVGSKLKSGNAGASFLPDFEVAVYMQGSGSIKGVIKTVSYYLGNGNLLAKVFTGDKGDVKAPFRVKIYSCTDKQMPGEELTKDVIVTAAKKNNEWFDVDVLAYHIKNPEKGFFVAFCLLDNGYYQTRNLHGFSSSAYIFTPRLGFTQNKTTLSYIGTHGITGLHWHKDTAIDYLVRAVVETQ